jgi:hypothetical protein
MRTKNPVWGLLVHDRQEAAIAHSLATGVLSFGPPDGLTFIKATAADSLIMR